MGRGKAIRKTQENRIKDEEDRDKGSNTSRLSNSVITRLHLKDTLYVNWDGKREEYITHYQKLNLNTKRTIEISEELNIPHNNKDNEPVYATTDFMVTIERNSTSEEKVRTVKNRKIFPLELLKNFRLKKRILKNSSAAFLSAFH